MRRFTLQRLLLCGALMLAATNLYAQTSSPAESERLATAQPLLRADLETRALQQVANRTGEPFQQLGIVNCALAQFPISGKSAHHFKVLSQRSTEIYGVLLDDYGRELDEEQLHADEQAAYFARYGRLDLSLAEHLATISNQEELVEVILWLKEPPYTPPPLPDPATPMTLEQVEEYYRWIDASRAAFVQSVVAPAAQRFWELGYLAETNDIAPVLYLRLPVRMVQEISRETTNWPEVDRIYLPGKPEPQLAVSRRTIGADVVHNRGITGRGVRIGVVEPYCPPPGTPRCPVTKTGRVAALYGDPDQPDDDPRENPYLFPTVFVVSHPLGETDAGEHATGVAGVIGSKTPAGRPPLEGIAPGVWLWTGAGSSDAQLQGKSREAINWGSVALNLSWGRDTDRVLGGNDRFYDSLVVSNARSVVAGAGNEGRGDGDITSPGLAYNVITVGAFDDGNAVTWIDDLMADFSSFRDPISTRRDRQKPEVAAPGVNITTTSTAAPWNNYTASGTSLAAPHVTGTIALMVHSAPTLALRPEALKAILMCDAIHNIEGNQRLSDRDGAGAIVANIAERLAQGIGGGWAHAFRDLDCEEWDDIPLDLAGRQRIRAVIVWSTNPAHAEYPNRPNTDYDLRLIRGADNRLVDASASFDNTYEIIDYTVPADAGGRYIIRIRAVRCSNVPIRRAYAYWIGAFGNAYVNVADALGKICQTIELTAILHNIATDDPIANKPITFKAGTITLGTANTNADGVATLNYTISDRLGVGARTLIAEFPGDATYNLTSGAGTLIINKGDTSMSVENQAGQRGQTVPLRATLRCVPTNDPVRNKTIIFRIDGVQVGTAITNANGIATFNYTIPNNMSAGAHTIRAIFNGDDLYNPSVDVGTLAVDRVIIQGRIRPQDLVPGPQGLSARIVVKQGANRQAFFGILNSDGDYLVLTSLSGAGATVSVEIGLGSWLRKRQNANLTGVVNLNFSLMNGDLTGDNRIDNSDIEGVLDGFGRTGFGWPQDLNHDDSVNDNDLRIVMVNFGRVGDPE